MDGADEPRALLLRVHSLHSLPQALVKLLNDDTVVFIGRGVGGDVAKINRDFDDAIFTVSKTRKVDLDSMVKSRGLTCGRQNTLEKIAELTVGVNMVKNPEIRLSKWSAQELTADQLRYAAMDVIVPLRIYESLMKKPDLCKRFTLSEVHELIVHQTAVDIVPMHGSQSTLATRMATGNLVSDDSQWTPPSWCEKTPTQKSKVNLVLVRITKIYATSFVVPFYKKSGDKVVTLGDFGDAPFDMLMPLKALAPCYAVEECTKFLDPNDNSSESAAARELQGELQDDACAGNNVMSAIVAKDLAVETPAILAKVPAAKTPAVVAKDPAAGTPALAPASDVQSTSDDFESSSAFWESLGENFTLTEEELSWLRASTAAVDGDVTSSCVKTAHFRVAPTVIVDIFSSVLGDPFHYMDRAKVPMHHSHKKAFVVALSRAWFVFEPVAYANVIAALKSDGLSEEQIETKLYFDLGYFLRRVPRLVLFAHFLAVLRHQLKFL